MRISLPAGRSYVVYAYENKDGLLVANICSLTATVDRAQADLAYLRSLPNSGQFGYIYGVAGNGRARAVSTKRFGCGRRLAFPE